MRARLAKAAFEVIAERGHAALRTAAVSERAGVSQGALLHHFPNKDAVTTAAIGYALQRAADRSEQRLARVGEEPGAILDAMMEDFEDFFGGDDFWVSLDVTMDALKNDEIKPVIRELVATSRAPIYQAWEQKLRACGWPSKKAAIAVRSLMALSGGKAIRSLWADDEGLTPQAYAFWREAILKEDKQK